MPSKKIMFIHHGGGIGGAPVSMLQLAAALNHSRYSVSAVFTETGPILDIARHLEIPAKVVTLLSAFCYGAHVPIRLRMLLPFLYHFRSTIMNAEEFIRNQQPDIVHLNTIALIPAAIGVKRTGVPLVWHVREIPGTNPIIRKWQTRIISRLADIIIVNSNYVKRFIPDSGHIHVIHNAVDFERFDINETTARLKIRDEFNIPDDSTVVSMIGTVQEVKGHFLLAESAKEVVKKNPAVRFMIIAGGVKPDYKYTWKGRVKRILGKPMDNLDRMRRLISRAGLEQNFIFTGYRQDIPELLAASDIVAFLSQKAEGFGRPLIEAMAAGLPVVATDVGPTKEILGTGTSILVPTRNSVAIAKAIIELLGDKDRQKQLGLKGRKRANQYFGMDQHVSKIGNIYDSILAKSDGR